MNSHRIAYVSYRLPFPFFVGGDGLVANFMLNGLERFLGWQGLSLGSINHHSLPISLGTIRSVLQKLNISYYEQINSEATSLKEVTRISYLINHYRSEMLHAGNFLENMILQLKQFKPDVVVTAEENSLEIIRTISDSMKVPVVLRVNHAEWTEEEIYIASQKVSLIIFVSNFIAQKYRHVTHCNTAIVHPIYDWRLWMVKQNSRRFISMLNPVTHKGGDIFIKIVKSLPDKFFLAQGGAKQPDIKLEDHTNLEWRSRVLGNIENNMGLSYFLGNTKFLLLPSQWEDAMPGIAIQAMKNGIPVIGSNRGGIPEIIGDAGIIINDYQSIEAWITAVRRLDSDVQLYNKLSSEAKKQAARFSFKEDIFNLANILNREVL